jgi:broad specificity phosphatase PhoE
MIGLLLGRHGETDWNREGRWQGHADRSLNAAGQAQAAALGARIVALGPTALYSSDLVRAWETADAVARATGLTPIATPGVREVDVGDWTGYTRAEVEERHPERYRAYRDDAGTGYPGGETFTTLKRRSVAAIDQICAGHADGELVAVICHGGTIRALASAALGLSRAGRVLAPGPTNGSLSQMGWEAGALRVVSFNDTGHLDPTDLI